ncbi:MAG: hypothetical protein WA771_13515 [Chthoniobacterales bacterium]
MNDTNTSDTYKSRFEDGIASCEQKIREEPLKAVLIGSGAGLVLSRLPILGLLILVIRLALWAVKPALLIAGLTKAYDYAKEKQMI